MNKVKALQNFFERNGMFKCAKQVRHLRVTYASGSFWYHTTTRGNLSSILENGLKVNSNPNYSRGSLDYMNDIYGMVPIFVAKNPELYDNDEEAVLLKVDVSGLELVADIPTLASHFGAYIEEDGIWFGSGNNRAASFEGEDEIYYDDLINPNSYYCKEAIDLTGTAAIMQDISSDKIIIL